MFLSYDAGAGLAAAALVGMVPSYISRSVAGSYDNEGVAIFALVFVFYTFIKVGAGGSSQGAWWFNKGLMWVAGGCVGQRDGAPGR